MRTAMCAVLRSLCGAAERNHPWPIASETTDPISDRLGCLQPGNESDFSGRVPVALVAGRHPRRDAPIGLLGTR